MDYEQQIILPNDVAAISRLAEFINRACEAAGVDEGFTMQLKLAAEEAVVNMMNYAYPPGTKGDIEVSSRIAGTTVTLVIRDSGVPFDPTAKADADTTLTAEERPIGGLGIYLVRRLMDSIAYERTADGKNVLTMKKEVSS